MAKATRTPATTRATRKPKPVKMFMSANERGIKLTNADPIDITWQPSAQAIKPLKHQHYFRDVAHLKHVDVYRVLALFGVTDPALAHAVKKVLVAGGRGAKDAGTDVQDAIDTLERWQAMQVENAAAATLG